VTISGYKDILEHAIAFLKDDYTELWLISEKIKDLNPEFNTTEIIEATKIISTDLVTNHRATLVDMNTERPMNKPTSETITVIAKHLTQLNREPKIGDGLWLSIENNSA